MPDSYDGHNAIVADDVAMNNRGSLRGSSPTFDGGSDRARRGCHRDTSIAGVLG